MRTWKREGYIVVEKDFDYDLHEFEVIRDDETIAGTITPDSIESMNHIIDSLDNNESVDGWEDGNGNTIII